MPNDSRSVGRPNNNPARMEPRGVPVQHDKARINDQRKVHPHSAGEPTMGVRPSGGAQKEPKKPALGKERMQARDVPMKRMTEAELNEWNPFRRYTKSPLPMHEAGDVLAWHHGRDGIHVMHVRDGKLVGQPTLVLSKDILRKKMQDAMHEYWQAAKDNTNLTFNPKKAGMSAIALYANKHGIQPVKTGEWGVDIPAVAGFQPGAGNRASQILGGNAGSSMGGSDNADSGESPMSVSSGPMKVSGWPGNGSSSSPDQNYKMHMKGGTSGMNSASGMNGASSMNGAANGHTEPEAPREVSGGLTTREKANFLKRVDPQRYTDRVLQQMMQAPYQIDQAYKRLGKVRGAAREAYPDTSFERDEPAHDARIGDLGWHGHMAEPQAPALNLEFIQARELHVEKVHEMAEREMDKLTRRVASRLGFKDIVFEDDCESTDEPDAFQQHMKKKETDKKNEGTIPRLRLRWVGEAGHLPEPTKPLPGNIAGSGKDFRQKPGHNQSPKQPGNLIGSRKVNKVKPGFVG